MARTLDAVVEEMDACRPRRSRGHVRRDQPRFADGRPRQQRCHPQPDPARLRVDAEGSRHDGPRRRSPWRPKFAEALQAAATGAYQAVLKPIEGTILTVARESAEAAKAAADDGRVARRRGPRRPRRRQAGARQHARATSGARRRPVSSTPAVRLPAAARLGAARRRRRPAPGGRRRVDEFDRRRCGLPGGRPPLGRRTGRTRRQRAAVRGDVLPRSARRAHRRLQARLGSDRRLDRRRRRRRTLELPRAHERRRRRRSRSRSTSTGGRARSG